MFRIPNNLKLILIVLSTVILVYIGFEYIMPLFLPFIIAYFIAWLLLPVVKFLNKKLRIPRILAGIVSLILLASGSLSLAYVGLKHLIQQTTTLVRNMPIYLNNISEKLDGHCLHLDTFLNIKEGTIRGFINSNIDNLLNTIKTEILPYITRESFGLLIKFVGSFGIIIIVIISILFFIKDGDIYSNKIRHSSFYDYVQVITDKLYDTGIAYLKTQGMIGIVIGLLCSIGLFLIDNKYALLIGIGIAILDAFPVLGTGIILIPWTIISLFNKEIFDGAILMSVYLGCQIVRETLEPRLLGNHIGIKPIHTLISMYVGLKVYGVTGFILGPISLVFIFTIVKEIRAQLEI